MFVQLLLRIEMIQKLKTSRGTPLVHPTEFSKSEDLAAAKVYWLLISRP